MRQAEGLHEAGQEVLALLHLDVVDLLQELLLLARQLVELLLHGLAHLHLLAAAARLQQLRLLQHVHLQLLVQLVQGLLVQLLLWTRRRQAGSRAENGKGQG